MKQFVIGFVSAVTLLLLIAASDAGYSVVWDFELKRPEAQKAISEYVRQNCVYILHKEDIAKALAEGTSYSAPWSFTCNVAAPPKTEASK
jgi:hypothetical protein